MTRAHEIIIRDHATAVRTPGDVVAAVVGENIHGAYRALVNARFDAEYGPVAELAADLERDFPRNYQKRSAE